MRDFGVELDRETRAGAEGLRAEDVALGQQLRAARQIEALAMPLILVGGPVADRAPRRRRPHRIIADLGLALRMREHALAELLGQHLRAEADAEIRLALFERHADPVDLGLDEVVGIVGALRAAEDHRAGMLRHRGGEGIAKARPADVELIAALTERIADAPGRRLLLMQDDEDFFSHGVKGFGRSTLFNS